MGQIEMSRLPMMFWASPPGQPMEGPKPSRLDKINVLLLQQVSELQNHHHHPHLKDKNGEKRKTPQTTTWPNAPEEDTGKEDGDICNTKPECKQNEEKHKCGQTMAGKQTSNMHWVHWKQISQQNRSFHNPPTNNLTKMGNKKHNRAYTTNITELHRYSDVSIKNIDILPNRQYIANTADSAQEQYS